MALPTATITYNLADMVGADFDVSQAKVWVTTNVPGGAIADTVGNAVRLGDGLGTLAEDGTGTLSVWTPGTGSNPASWQTYIHVSYAPRLDGWRPIQRTFGPFTITGDANLADLVAEQEVPPTYVDGVVATLQSMIDQGLKGPVGPTGPAGANGGSDASTADNVTNGTATKAALSATYVSRWKATTAYAVGDKVLTPGGNIVQAIAAHTSGATYSGTNWTTAADLVIAIDSRAPRGELEYAETNIATVVNNSTATNVPGLDITVANQTRPVMLEARFPFLTGAGVTTLILLISEVGGPEIARSVTDFKAAGSLAGPVIRARVPANRGIKQYRVRAYLDSGTTAVTLQNAYMNAYLRAEGV